ncbi:hypothetical protein ABZY09_46350 [Streptomyces sp. NPDC002928]|uniref:hypothetical protein n=1 Tax=Streptomyces sp. NPDC002928 TaxID=3154440 RepID=UPI0033A64B7B
MVTLQGPYRPAWTPPLAYTSAPTEGAEPARGGSGVLVTGADEEMLVLEVTAADCTVLACRCATCSRIWGAVKKTASGGSG